MRVRYGKEISAASLIKGCVPTNLTLDGQYSGLGITLSGAFAVSGGYSPVTCSTISGHTYFWAEKYIIPAGSTFDLARLRPSIYIPDIENHVYYDNPPYVSDGYCMTVLPVQTGGATNFHFRASSSVNVNQPFTICYRIVIDLTSIGLDHLTAQQFYSRCKGSLEALSTGATAVVDSKSGRGPAPYKLPDGYLELEYVESTGTQYIDTLVAMSDVSKIVTTIKNSRPSTLLQYNPFLGRYSSSSDTLQILENYASNLIACRWCANNLTVATDDSWHNIILSNTLIKIDNTSLPISSGLASDTDSIYVFARRTDESGAGIQQYGYWQTRGIQLFGANNILVRNFIPAIRKSDTVVGLFDTVNNIFYTNQGTGAFVAGPVKNLPSEYQQVEYVESSGTQYIDTGYMTTGTEEYRFETVLEFSTLSTSNYYVIGADNGYGYGVTPSNSKFFWSDLTATTNTKYNIGFYSSANARYGVVNGVSYSTNAYTYPNQKVLLFARGRDSVVREYATYKLYNFKLYINNALIRSFIPCYRKSDNVIGMYDLVGRQFYTNVGTGTFLKGNDVSSTVSRSPTVKMYGYNQLLSGHDLIGGASGGITYTVDNDAGTVTTSGNPTAWSYKKIYDINLDPGTMIMVRCQTTNNKLNIRAIKDSQRTGFVDASPEGSIGTLTNGADRIEAAIGEISNIYEGSVLSKMELVNLTDWFGAGNEPTTIAEFKERFNKDYYGYCPDRIMLTERQINALPVYGYNQLVSNGDFADGITGWSAYNSNNIEVTVVNRELTAKFLTSEGSTSTFSWGFRCYTKKPVYNNKYLILINMYTSYAGSYGFDFNNTALGKIFSVSSNETNKWIEKGVICTANADNNATQCIIMPISDCAIPQGAIIKCNKFMIVDLTDWYGAGNEPTTVGEFQATFPYKYYPFSLKRLLNKYQINGLGKN